MIFAKAGADITSAYQNALKLVQALQDQATKGELLQQLGDAKVAYEQKVAEAKKAEEKRLQEEQQRLQEANAKAQAEAKAKQAYSEAYNNVLRVETLAATETTVSANFTRAYQSALAKVNALTHAAQKSMLLSS